MQTKELLEKSLKSLKKMINKITARNRRAKKVEIKEQRSFYK